MTMNRTERAPRVAINRIQEAWESMSDTDKQALLGHTDNVLTPADKIRIAKMARAAGAAARQGKPASFRRGVGPADRGYRGGLMGGRK